MLFFYIKKQMSFYKGNETMLNFLITVGWFKFSFFKINLYHQNFIFFFYFKPYMQVFLCATLILFFKKKLPLFSFLLVDFYINKSENLINDLYNNNIFFLHPNFLLITFFFVAINAVTLKKKILKYFIFLLICGMFWSMQEVFWNGIWDWNTLELSNLILLFFFLIITHFKINLLKKNQQVLLILITLLFFNNFFNIKSVHSFFFLPINKITGKFLFFLIFFFLKKSTFSLVSFFCLSYTYFWFISEQNFFYFNKTFVLIITYMYLNLSFMRVFFFFK